MSGVLVIWNDCAPHKLKEYESWYREEHLPERMAIPGFMLGRRFEAVQADQHYLTLYTVDRVDTLFSDAYRTRVSNPSPRTTEIMADGFINMTRAVCSRKLITGSGNGSYIVTAASATEALSAAARHTPNPQHEAYRCVSHEIWAAVTLPGSMPSKEEMLRGKDSTICECLATEFAHQDQASRYADILQNTYPALNVGVFRLMSFMSKGNPE